MLDQKGIKLSEVNRKYPRSCQPLGYDVLLDTDAMYKPRIISSFEMTVNAIVTLLMMKPGQYPSIPDLGLDIEQYLFEYTNNDNLINKLQASLYDQMDQLDISGVSVQFYIDTTSEGIPALLITITGNDYICYGLKSNKVIIGISYTKLNEVYIKKVYEERSASI